MQNSKQKQFINSCFNYTGNKYRQLQQLFNLFPSSTNTFVDLFCGGGVVGLNAIQHMDANKVILNDKSKALIDIFNFLREQEYSSIYNQIIAIINKYGLSNTKKYGYKYYGVDSSKGLAQVNKEGFFKLRDDYNAPEYKLKYPKPIVLYTLIIFAFNNQIRFNKQGQFNLPVGKRDFNKNIQTKLLNFINLLHKSDVTISNLDFSDVKIPSNSFVYCDPPYTITTAAYNERNLWTEEDDLELFKVLDTLDKRNIPFALSNVLIHKGNQNRKLIEWSSKYNIHYIDFNYNNSNYHSRAKEHATREVLITNY